MARDEATLKAEGMNALITALGTADTERFISLILGKPFDYTEMRHLFLTDGDGLTAAEFGEKIMRELPDNLPPIGSKLKQP